VPQLRKTKIICTLGPAVDSVESMVGLLRAGMNVARFNFSHGNHEEHRERIARIREAGTRADIPVALMMDTKGPEIRTGPIADDAKIEIARDDRITITTDEVDGTRDRIGITYKQLPHEVGPGKHIFVADGLIDLEVERVEGHNVHCLVRSGGVIGSRKNVNIPGVRVSLPSMTEKDKADIVFAMENGMDYIAASFIRNAGNVTEIQDLIASRDSLIRVIAKIEDLEGLENIDEIIRVSSGVMVARGDLGVQLSTEDIPLAQKRIIEKCNVQNKPVITATQMLDSMIHNPKPTRAELTDVANAIFDGTDAVMLSGETATGKYPLGAVETMHKIAMAVETSDEYRRHCEKYFDLFGDSEDIGHAVAKSAYLVARETGAAAIVAPTLRGNTPRLISKFRPPQSIIAATTSEQAYRQLLLHWGIFPILTEHVQDSDLMIQNALRKALRSGYAKRLDKVVTAAGIPLNSPIPMNTIKVHFLGSILNRGHKGFGKSCSGRVVLAESSEEAALRLQRDGNEILVTRSLDPMHRELLSQVRGVILEETSTLSPEEIREENPEIVYIAEVPHALQTFEPSQIVSLDGEEKIIYEGMLD
jgi:pyruvate kinase